MPNDNRNSVPGRNHTRAAVAFSDPTIKHRVSRSSGDTAQLCPECGGMVMIRVSDGALRNHRKRGYLCIGSGQLPSTTARPRRG